MSFPSYNDAYSSCADTYSTLRIYHDTLPPTIVTDKLGIEPDRQYIKGQKKPGQKRADRVNGWLLESDKKVDSLDSRRHIDWLVDQIYTKKSAIHELINQGFELDIFSYWLSESANGGPTLSPYQMQRLVELQIEVSWDVYF